jgi:site-specific DNA-methyltransferase (adenine-specific)
LKPPFPEGCWDVLLIDPPWSYYGQQDKWGAAAKFYDTMADEDITDLPIGSLMSNRSVAFIWATGPRLDFAVDSMRSWGLHYRGVAFVWVKTRLDGTPIGAQGVRPSIVKPTTEFVLAASPIRTGRPLPLSSESIRQVVLAPRRKHSQKPDEVHERIEAMYPTARRLELFARSKRAGWDCWGDEV